MSLPSPESQPEPEFSEPVSSEHVQEQAYAPESAPVKNMRRFFRFRIKTLGLITGGIAAASAFVSLPFHEAGDNKTVQKRVQKKNAIVWTVPKTKEAGLRYIFKPIQVLQSIDLNDQWCTDEDIFSFQLHHAKDLKILKLSSTNITDVSIPALENMKSLESLSIGHTRITNKGLLGLLNMPQLQLLSIENMPHITDEGLKHLVAHPGLTHLTIGGPGITDAGLRHLEKATHLKSIFLTRCNATEEGMARLQKALPECSVSGLADMRYMGDTEKFPVEHPRENEKNPL